MREIAPSMISLDLDGTGIVTSPVGFLDLPFFNFNGSGLVGSPVGFLDFRLLVLNGSGIVTSPVGISAFAFFTFDGSGIVGSPVGLWSPTPLPLSEGGLPGMGGTSVGTWYDAGGFQTADGYTGATALASSEFTGVEVSSIELEAVGERGLEVP